MIYGGVGHRHTGVVPSVEGADLADALLDREYARPLDVPAMARAALITADVITLR